MDIEALGAAAAAVGRLIADESSGITNLDLNPVIVGDVGQGCCALDAGVYVAA